MHFLYNQIYENLAKFKIEFAHGQATYLQSNTLTYIGKQKHQQILQVFFHSKTGPTIIIIIVNNNKKQLIPVWQNNILVSFSLALEAYPIQCDQMLD